MAPKSAIVLFARSAATDASNFQTEPLKLKRPCCYISLTPGKKCFEKFSHYRKNFSSSEKKPDLASPTISWPILNRFQNMNFASYEPGADPTTSEFTTTTPAAVVG
jgi:hypothetical protein